MQPPTHPKLPGLLTRVTVQPYEFTGADLSSDAAPAVGHATHHQLHCVKHPPPSGPSSCAPPLPSNWICPVAMWVQILALMLLRQRGMRLTIISILDDLAVKLPPLRHSIKQVRQQFASRFKHEDTMMQQITPPGFNAAEKVTLL